MKKNTILFIISFLIIILAVVYTFLVKKVDVKPVGVNNTDIGFASINKPISDTLGYNELLYKATEYLGYLPLLFAAGYALYGGFQLVKRKSIFKVDKEIIALGGFFVVILALYVFFEKFVVNYRPVLLDGGELEASYPSSHTLMSICFCMAMLLINIRLFKENNLFKYFNIFLMILMVVIVVGRFLSGVHWFTDILGGIFISAGLVMTFNTVLNLFSKDEQYDEYEE